MVSPDAPPSGLVDEVQVTVPTRRIGVEADRHRVRDERTAAAVHLVEDVEESLALDLGKRIDHASAQDRPPADQRVVALVRELEDVFRPCRGRR